MDNETRFISKGGNLGARVYTIQPCLNQGLVESHMAMARESLDYISALCEHLNICTEVLNSNLMGTNQLHHVTQQLCTNTSPAIKALAPETPTDTPWGSLLCNQVYLASWWGLRLLLLSGLPTPSRTSRLSFYGSKKHQHGSTSST